MFSELFLYLFFRKTKKGRSASAVLPLLNKTLPSEPLIPYARAHSTQHRMR